jgi:DUF1680 family protein
MKTPSILSILLSSLFSSVALHATAPAPSHDYPVRPVPFTEVHLNDFFWAPRIETNRSVSIPFAFKQCEDTARLLNFEEAAAALQGRPLANPKMTEFPFDDTDIYKVLEGASYALSVKPDPKLDAYLDFLIAKIAAAQEPDGYIYTFRTMKSPTPHKWVGAERWVNERVLSHELYNLGHLYEAAVAHYQATGKRSLLDVALRSADLLDKTFGPGKQTIWPGHQIVEMGLAKLYRCTGDERYIRLAKFMLDSRHPDGHPGSGPYNQSNKPVVEQSEAIGHAVRAGYMYAGMADVAALTGDLSYVQAIDRIWNDVVQSKLYLTGGIGARHQGEAFGAAYELPNLSAYNETCAAIANVYWNQRLFLLHGDARYADVLECTLYNGVLSGVSLDGKGFFYPNPLESDGSHQRQPWFGCACCPGNMTRFLASVSGYQYAQSKGRVYANLYASGRASLRLENGDKLELEQKTAYPWDGRIELVLGSDKPVAFSLLLRVPGWARNEPLPGNLYRFEDRCEEAPLLKLNGVELKAELRQGYLEVTREWKPGDRVELWLPMPVRRVRANDKVEADRGRVALQRGPIVYCVEDADNGAGISRRLSLSGTASLSVEQRPDMLGGISVIRGIARLQGGSDEKSFLAIPYFAWANRGKNEMCVWLHEAPGS